MRSEQNGLVSPPIILIIGPFLLLDIIKLSFINRLFVSSKPVAEIKKSLKYVPFPGLLLSLKTFPEIIPFLLLLIYIT